MARRQQWLLVRRKRQARSAIFVLPCFQNPRPVEPESCFDELAALSAAKLGLAPI
jgi:hypothetical protein